MNIFHAGSFRGVDSYFHKTLSRYLYKLKGLKLQHTKFFCCEKKSFKFVLTISKVSALLYQSGEDSRLLSNLHPKSSACFLDKFKIILFLDRWRDYIDNQINAFGFLQQTNFTTD
jgi:hypothetical protein